MKNFLAAVGLLAGLTSARPIHGPSDEPKSYPKSVATRATTLTQVLAQRIQFNEGQYVQVKKLHLHYLEERRQLELELNLAKAPAAERDEKFSAAQYRYERALSRLLTPDQRVAYQQLRASLTAHQL
jgi:hypothetical protein